MKNNIPDSLLAEQEIVDAFGKTKRVRLVPINAGETPQSKSFELFNKRLVVADFNSIGKWLDANPEAIGVDGLVIVDTFAPRYDKDKDIHQVHACGVINRTIFKNGAIDLNVPISEESGGKVFVLAIVGMFE